MVETVQSGFFHIKAYKQTHQWGSDFSKAPGSLASPTSECADRKEMDRQSCHHTPDGLDNRLAWVGRIHHMRENSSYKHQAEVTHTCPHS